MITKRTKLLQILTASGWEYVFCYSMSDGRVVSTEDYRKALRAENREYIATKTPAQLREVRPVDIELSESVGNDVATTVSGAARPSIEALIDADSGGLTLKNPDNEKVFRVVFVESMGATGVRIYDPPQASRPARSPLMGRMAIGDWLSGLVFA